MKFSLLIASGLVAIVAIVGAGAYKSSSYSQGGQGCGYDCRNAQSYNSHYEQSGARSAHGPYHSYAVRPAIYGGYGMYHYKGYARHPLPPPNAHYRKVRSSHHGSGSGHYGMRPVKALVLAPAYSGSQSISHYPPASKSYGAHKQYAPKPSYPKPSYPTPSYPMPSYPKPSYPKPSYSMPSYPKPSYPKHSYPKHSYPKPSYPKPSYPMPSYPMPSYPKPSYSKPSYPKPSSYGGHYQAPARHYGNQKQHYGSSAGGAAHYKQMNAGYSQGHSSAGGY